jgi:pimeloyl-ACP methyl ester carboxylesterase
MTKNPAGLTASQAGCVSFLRMQTFSRDGLIFEVTDAGPSDGRVVIALHGFPEDRECWSQLAEPLTAAGYRVLAPDQRGYSPGARPKGRRAYDATNLRDDVFALADSAGAQRFDVVGHDWGGFVAWDLAARNPERVRSCTSLSTPHPRAIQDVALKSTQLLHLWYALSFQVPVIPELTFKAIGSARGAKLLERGGLDPETATHYASRFAHPDEMAGPIDWYRALPFDLRDQVPDVAEVSTLFVWGEADRYLTRPAALATARHVTAPYRFESLSGAPHWLPTAAADRIGPLLLEHLASTAD